MKVPFVLILPGLILATEIGYADPNSEANLAVNQAVAMQQKADSVGGEWRDTGAIIQQAQAALQKGDFNQALALAQQAKRQAELGYQQAIQNQKADFPAYLR